MAKKSAPRRRSTKKQEESEDENAGVERLTLETLDAISSEEDSDGDIAVGDSRNNGGDDNEWNAEAQALREAIADGAFDSLISKNEEPLDEEDNDNDVIPDDEEEEEEENEKEEEEDDMSEEEDNIMSRNRKNNKALLAVTEEMIKARRNMPWAESFDVVSKEELPFATDKLVVHDDLKREYAFYNITLDAVNIARKKCEEAAVPFARPDDFFAEMIKTDDHMAKVKDRLIFETKKMDAFEQRKQNKEFKLHAKETRAHKLSEKSKQKRTMLDKVEGYKNAHRGGGTLNDDDDNKLMGRLDPKRKREIADKKYGHGGKKGRFKQNDPKGMNDMSSYNPKGNSSSGQKGGKKRHGKRARDASRSK